MAAGAELIYFFRILCSVEKAYDRIKAVLYAKEWAFKRNPKYYNFDAIGGDCTNFISQCLYAGCGVMNYSRNAGWYYVSLSNRAPAWTSVELLHDFLISNQKAGPYAVELPLSYAKPGDIIQLSFDGITYGHSLLVVSVGQIPSEDNILIATHTDDSYNRALSSYFYYSCRLLHIEGNHI